jgi:hypothetical protein
VALSSIGMMTVGDTANTNTRLKMSKKRSKRYSALPNVQNNLNQTTDIMIHTPTPARVKVTRADLRNRKIILVIEPDLLSDEVFSYSPFWDDGEDKSKLQKVRINLGLLEKNGNIEIENCEYAGHHFTTDNSQITDPNDMFVDKKDHVINEILTTQFKYIEEEYRMNKLLGIWDNDIEFKNKLISLINSRKEKHKKKILDEALRTYEEARKNLEDAMFSNGLEKNA